MSGSNRHFDRAMISPYLRRPRRTLEEAEADSRRTHRDTSGEVVPRAERTDNRSFGDEA